MSALQNVSPQIRVCPFCGLATDVNHETQEGCIAALHEEIARMRGLLAQLRPAGSSDETDPIEEPEPAKAIRLVLD